MPNVGPLEFVIVMVIALLVLGPRRLPQAGRSLGRSIREFKDALAGGPHEGEEAASELAAEPSAPRASSR